jgi:hypothetical protein
LQHQAEYQVKFYFKIINAEIPNILDMQLLIKSLSKQGILILESIRLSKDWNDNNTFGQLLDSDARYIMVLPQDSSKLSEYGMASIFSRAK